MHPTLTAGAPEASLATAGATGAALVAVPTAVVVGAFAGLGPGGAALVGALIVAVAGCACIPLYRAGAALPDEMSVAVGLAAMGLRLVLGVAAVAALTLLAGVPGAPLGIGVAAALVASVVFEMRAANRDPRYWWIDATARTSRTSSERQHS